MTIKVTRDKCCTPSAFEPYALTLEVESYQDHLAIKYLSLASTTVPQTLYKKANESVVSGKYRPHATTIKDRSNRFLIQLGYAIPIRKDPSC